MTAAAAAPPDPTRLDVAAFARHHGRWHGDLPLAAFGRLLGDAHPEAPPAADAQVHVRADGRNEPRPTGERHWLHLQAGTSMAVVCQRCLGPVEVPLEVDRHFLFAPDEAAAAALDAELEDDVLVEEHPFDLQALVEDELLLAVPLVPMHAVCPDPLPAAAPESAAEAPRHPFAALAQLKRRE